jgi:hypothetical protein
MNIKQIVWKSVLKSTDSWYGPAMGSCEHGNKV